jgi:hypothetical protein
MSKVARLIGISLLTRVIVDEDWNEEELNDIAVRQFKEKLDTEGIWDSVDQNTLDEELPYGSLDSDLKDERKYPVTYSTIKNLCGWMEFCNVTGVNEWAVNEGRVDESSFFYVKETHARQLGLIK